jgi:hypothetical protein
MKYRIPSVVCVVAVVLLAYFVLARPYQLRWGATTEEIARPMPGDDLDLTPAFLSTRAITIDTSAEAIWPWLVQMGFNRAGFYGYDVVEGLGSERGMQSAEVILTEFQNPRPGDVLPISVAAKTRFHAIEPHKYLIWSSGPSTGGFTWALYPIDSHHTRLVSRIRWTHHWSQPGVLALEILTEFTDHLAVRKILHGIKLRAESKPHQSFTVQTLEFSMYLAVLLLFLASLVILLVRPFKLSRSVASLALGVLLLLVWYGPFL